jgi:hypothetical protein
MFITPLFTTERSGSQPNVQKPDKFIEKYVVYILMIHNPAIRNEIMLFAEKCMEMEINLLRKISQADNHMFSLIHRT